MADTGSRESVATQPARPAKPAGADRRYLTDEEPWTPRGFLGPAVVVVIGLVALGICWYGVSGEATLEDQTPWLAGAVLSTIVSATGTVLWLVLGFRAVRGGQRQVVADARVALGLDRIVLPRRGVTQPTSAGSATPSVGDPSPVLVTARGMSRVHRLDCPLVRGKVVREVPVDQMRVGGLSSCGVCRS
jgi:hypothetical protein